MTVFTYIGIAVTVLFILGIILAGVAGISYKRGMNPKSPKKGDKK